MMERCVCVVGLWIIFFRSVGVFGFVLCFRIFFKLEVGCVFGFLFGL